VRLASAAAVKKSLRPQRRPGEAVVADATPDVGNKQDIEKALLAAAETITEEAKPVAQGSALAKATPKARPKDLVLASVDAKARTTPNAKEPAGDPIQKVVTRISTSGGRHWGINVGRYPSEYKARKVLLKTALNEMETLDGSLRKVVKRSTGFEANFMGLTRESADLACRRLQAKQITCFMIDPGA